MASKQKLKSAVYVRNLGINLVFEDNLSVLLDIKKLQMPLKKIKWNTSTLSQDGSSIIVIGIKGDEYQIDSDTLRYLVDPIYAKIIDEELDKIRLTREELAEIAKNPPSPEEIREIFDYNSDDLIKPSFREPKMKEITFVGIPSGDYETFCWDVNRDTYIEIIGRTPELDDAEKSLWYKGMYRLYPGVDVPGCEDGLQQEEYDCPLKVSIKEEKIGNKRIFTMVTEPVNVT